MSRYDGLIIPRSYSEYINKTDAATLSQALQLGGVLDSAPTENSVKAVKSGGVFDALADLDTAKQDVLTFDDTPTEDSNNPVKSDGIYDAIKALLPIGLVFPFAGSTIPANFLECDGSAVSRTTYADLFTVIGTTYGTGDGSTTFNLPDYREVALVGAGQNSTDSIATHDVYTVGQFKDDQVQQHKHYIPGYTQNSQASITTYADVTGDINNNGTSQFYSLNIANARTGTTTRGKRKAVKYIIKAL